MPAADATGDLSLKFGGGGACERAGMRVPDVCARPRGRGARAGPPQAGAPARAVWPVDPPSHGPAFEVIGDALAAGVAAAVVTVSLIAIDHWHVARAADSGDELLFA